MIFNLSLTHASEHDGYQIRVDVSDIIRDVEKAVDKAGEL